MPTYDYKCTVCEYEFEYFQAMSDKLLSTCPKCDQEVRRLVGGGTGLIFKGSGFYLTDYARKNTSSPPKKEPTPVAKEPAQQGKQKPSP